MAATTFKIPRQSDREIISALQELGKQAGIPTPEIYIHPYDGANTAYYIPFAEVKKHELLKEILPLNDATFQSIALAGASPQRRNYVTVQRVGTELFDQVQINLDPNQQPRLSDEQGAKLIGLAKKLLKEIRVEGILSGLGSEEVTKYYEAREATLSRLEQMNQQLLYGIHERQQQLDKQFQKKSEDFEAQLGAQRDSQQKLFEEQMATVREREEALKTREAEFETRESKYLRRQHHKDMLKQLTSLSEKFQLTQGTRRLRWPIIIFLALFLVFCGTMTVLNFLQTSKLLDAAGNDLSKISWEHFTLLGLKQLGFAAGFLFGAWYFIKWNDRWLRQHADAEFMFKQMELDVNRASWVVEMASEWAEEKKADLPSHLVDSLTRNLFVYAQRRHDEAETPTDIPSLLLGASSTLKFKAPTGVELEMDRKGLKKIAEADGG